MKDIRGAVRRPRAMVYNNEMNPNNILLYLQIGVLFNHDLSGFLLKQIGKKYKDSRQIYTQIEKPWNTQL